MASFNLMELKRQGEENAKKESCTPVENPDPETGCRACGANSYSDYEQCRQSFYLKQQGISVKEKTDDNQILNIENPKFDTEEVEVKEDVNKEFQNRYDQLSYLSGVITVVIILIIISFLKKVIKK